LGTFILDKNYIKIKGKLNSGNDSYRPVSKSLKYQNTLNYSNLIQVGPAVLELKQADKQTRWTHKTLSISVLFLHTVQRRHIKVKVRSLVKQHYINTPQYAEMQHHVMLWTSAQAFCSDNSNLGVQWTGVETPGPEVVAKAKPSPWSTSPQPVTALNLTQLS
jgi:hypothetical protein